MVVNNADDANKNLLAGRMFDIHVEGIVIKNCVVFLRTGGSRCVCLVFIVDSDKVDVIREVASSTTYSSGSLSLQPCRAISTDGSRVVCTIRIWYNTQPSIDNSPSTIKLVRKSKRTKAYKHMMNIISLDLSSQYFNHGKFIPHRCRRDCLGSHSDVMCNWSS